VKTLINSCIAILLLVLIIRGFTSCEKIETGKEFDIKVGNKYNIDWNMSFTVDSIREYRCPIGLLCFWAGDVDLFFDIKMPFKQIDTLIYLSRQERNPFKIEGYTWKILEVNPYPKYNVTVDPKDIRIKMIITKD
jgi:hypothetical protein